MDLSEKIHQLVDSSLELLGVKLYKVELTNEGKERFLRLYVDKKSGTIDLDLIVKISDTISPLFDESEILEGNYILDISSLGAEREIDISDLADCVGKYIHVHIIHPIDGLNNYEGELLGHDGQHITIQYKVKTRVRKVQIAIEEIDHARFAIKF